MQSLPRISDARLPTVYVEAKKALEKCHHVDECKTWADKAAAMASYARQADDKSLLNTAVRIQARAIRRCGELLREIAPSKGGRPSKTSEGSHTSFTRKAAATAGGLSEHQRNQALRVAAIPEKTFEKAIEADDPATITELASMERRNAAARAPKPPGFQMATHTMGTLRRLAEFAVEASDVRLIVEAMAPHEQESTLKNAKVAQRWIGKLITKLGG